jgi:hypothetical protein
MPFDNLGNYQDTNVDFPQAVMGGGLPPGMLLNKYGLLYGRPLTTGTFLFRLHVRDGNGKHGEATIKLVVLNDEYELPPCSTPAVNPIPFKTTIAQTKLKPILTGENADSWKGKIEVIGGNKPYHYKFPNSFDAPNQQIPQNNAGAPLVKVDQKGNLSSTIKASDYVDYTGLWLWEVEVSDTDLPNLPPTSTCDRRALTLAINVEPVAGEGFPALEEQKVMLLPEGIYRKDHPSRLYLVIDPPTAVKAFPQGKNLFLRGSRGYTVRPDLEGPFIGPGPVTSTVPGVMNPVSLAGLYELEQAPSHIQLDWIVTNPISLYRDLVDRLEPLPPEQLSPPPPPSSEPELIKGASIDYQIPLGKRVRPLWPV